MAAVITRNQVMRKQPLSGLVGTARLSTTYPAGSVGADPARRFYIKYLVERYHQFKEVDFNSGKGSRHSFAVIYSNIKAKFKTSAYFLPVKQYDELVRYLQGRIDRTLLGKRNQAREYASYKTFDEFEMDMSEAAV